MYTIWFKVGDNLQHGFTGNISAARAVYDALKAQGFEMSCTRP